LDLRCAALRAFAANSLLTRQALRTGEIDWPSFTLLRLASGAVMLGVLTRMQGLRASERAQQQLGNQTGEQLDAYLCIAAKLETGRDLQ